MARRRGRYKMTPRRRAALKKAQAASARKRRGQGIRNFAKTAAQIGGTVAAGALLYHVEGYARDPGKAVRHVKAVHGFVRHGRGVVGPTPRLPRSRPINPYRLGPRPIRHVRRISTGQRRAHQGRLF